MDNDADKIVDKLKNDHTKGEVKVDLRKKFEKETGWMVKWFSTDAEYQRAYGGWLESLVESLQAENKAWRKKFFRAIEQNYCNICGSIIDANRDRVQSVEQAHKDAANSKLNFGEGE